ncbi:hypothetical protein ACJRO7_021102, partial [Eucalyptus globulus]
RRVGRDMRWWPLDGLVETTGRQSARANGLVAGDGIAAGPVTRRGAVAAAG